MCNKKYLSKNFEEICFSKSTKKLKINKTFKSYLFLYSICFHSYTHLSNFRYDLILVVNEYQNLWISNFYAENKTFVSLFHFSSFFFFLLFSFVFLDLSCAPSAFPFLFILPFLTYSPWVLMLLTRTLTINFIVFLLLSLSRMGLLCYQFLPRVLQLFPSTLTVWQSNIQSFTETFTYMHSLPCMGLWCHRYLPWVFLLFPRTQTSNNSFVQSFNH